MRNSARNLATAGILMLATGLGPALAERGDDADRVSKNGLAEGAIDGVSVTVEYGRPNVKERTIWGGLVPYAKVWRTGANEATTVTFGGDVLVEGQALAAGTYGLFTVPGEDSWEVIFNKVPDQWGSVNYDAGQDALRVTVTPAAAEHAEAMTFEIEAGAIVLRWEKIEVTIGVAAAG